MSVESKMSGQPLHDEPPNGCEPAYIDIIDEKLYANVASILPDLPTAINEELHRESLTPDEVSLNQSVTQSVN